MRFLDVLEPVILIALPVFMVVCAWFRLPNAVVLTTAAAIITLVPFFARFELSHLRARDLMPIVVMSALAVAGRMILAPIPAIKPVMAIVVLTGLAFGKQSGFITGALTILVSNIFFGQGPWTPWQMYSCGLAGYIAGSVSGFSVFRKPPAVAALGFCLVFLYGGILDTWTLIGFVDPLTTESAIATYTVGLAYNTAHAIGTAAFLLIFTNVWFQISGRIKVKYGVGLQDGMCLSSSGAAAPATSGEVPHG